VVLPLGHLTDAKPGFDALSLKGVVGRRGPANPLIVMLSFVNA
jgi:hypothetical protein